VSSLVRPDRDDDESATLHQRAMEADARLRERDEELARVASELAAFRIEYRKEVGLLHEALDELERTIIAELAGFAENDPRRTARTASPAPPQIDASPRFTSDAVRTLFRDVAKAIHPDLAADDVSRDERHRLMVEANRAYALGDADRLRVILRSWEQSPEAVLGSDPESDRLRLQRRIAHAEERLSACERELAALRESPLWKLKVMVDAAAANGKDLVADMVGRLKRDIMVARNRLDALTDAARRSE
jgi:hypothetical protein